MSTADEASPRPEFAELGAFYTREIEPWLEQQEGRRRKARLLRWLIIGGGFAALAAWLYHVLTGDAEGFWFFIIIVLGFILIVVGNIPVARLKADVKQFVMGKLAQFFGFNYSAQPDFPDFRLLNDLLLVPMHDKRNFEDGLEGEIRGVKFKMVETHLTQRRKRGKNTKDVTVFRGLLLSIPYAAAGDDSIAVWREEADTWLSGGSLRQVSLRDPEFDEIYNVYSRDAEMAQRLLDPEAREAYMAFDQDESLEDARLGITGKHLLIALNTGTNSFEVGKIGQKLADPNRVQAMVEQFAILFDVVDAFGHRPARPEAAATGSGAAEA